MRYAIGGFIFVVLALVGGMLANNLLEDDPVPAPLPRATSFAEEEPFWGKVKRYAAVGPRVLEVKVRLLNTGNAEDEGECDIVPYDQTGAVSSVPVTTGGPATPGFGVIVTKRLRLQQPATSIERVEVAC